MNKIFVLGAPDAEMGAIERLLREHGVEFVHATVNGQRCHAGNAYKANNVLPDDVRPVFVECLVDGRAGHVIDHHRAGDFGFGQPPENFMNASSIGQVYKFLALEGLLDPKSEGMDHIGPYTGQIHFDGQNYTLANMGFHAPTVVFIPKNHVLVAAADHCLEAAYRGKCPSVNPAELLEFRIRSIAAFQNVPQETVKQNIDTAIEALKNAKKITLGGVEVADLADGKFIPQLPEAAAYVGIPFVAIAPSPDGRTKFVLQAAPAEAVTAFMRGEFKQLFDYYGDPARGFCGGYANAK